MIQAKTATFPASLCTQPLTPGNKTHLPQNLVKLLDEKKVSDAPEFATLQCRRDDSQLASTSQREEHGSFLARRQALLGAVAATSLQAVLRPPKAHAALVQFPASQLNNRYILVSRFLLTRSRSAILGWRWSKLCDWSCMILLTCTHLGLR